jgi:ABC-type multidrug transport system ATPase subunit
MCYLLCACHAGMLQPTSGTAYIAGHDITTSMAAIRQSLGICPQVKTDVGA